MKNSRMPTGASGNELAAPKLPLARYRFTFRADGGARLPEYLGSAWRGAFGRALKRAVCVTRQKTCGDCLLLRACAYPYVFDTPTPAGARKMRRYETIPHPFVLAPEIGVHRILQPGAKLMVFLTLFGKADLFLSYCIHALQQAGDHGLTPRRYRLAMEQVEQENPLGTGNWTEIHRPGEPCQPLGSGQIGPPTVWNDVRFAFRTPLRLQRNGRLVSEKNFHFTDLFRSLLRRISMLTEFHTDTPLETDFAGLVKKSEEVDWTLCDLEWKDWTRYSSRQEAEMQMGGIVGTANLRAQDLSPFWPYIWLGQFTHAGKGTSMGLGRYTLEWATSLPEQT